MALLRQLTNEEKRRYFTHKALYGLVPVYASVDMEEYNRGDDIPAVFMTERNGIPKYTLQLYLVLWRIFTIFYPRNPMLHLTQKL